MAGTLIFDPADVRRLVEHMTAAKKWSRGWGDKKKARPQLIFVHDDGLYLMSNGQPRDLVSGDEGNGRAFAAYAKGYHPEKDPDVWDNARLVVGGDDFAEYISLTPAMIAQIKSPEFRELRLGVTEDAFDLTIVHAAHPTTGEERLMAKTPIPVLNGLADAQELARAHPATFDAPSEAELRLIVPDDWVKICRAQERFWCRVRGASGKYLIGEVDVPLVNEGNADINIPGKLVRFEPRHIYQIMKPPSA